MKHLKYSRIIPAAILLLLISFTFTFSDESEEEVYNYKVTGIRKGKLLKVLEKPDPNSAVVDELKPDDYCVVSFGETVKKKNTVWMKIYTMVGEGWVPEKYMRLIENPEEDCPQMSG